MDKEFLLEQKKLIEQVNEIWFKHLKDIKNEDLENYIKIILKLKSDTVDNVWKKLPKKAIKLRYKIKKEIVKIDNISGIFITITFLNKLMEEGSRRWLITLHN
ncbi:MAG TPA: hypothetical protein PKI46_00970 [Bacteroidales bacterium]|nr:hypothetical protein [Bacteroidales bacterium]